MEISQEDRLPELDEKTLSILKEIQMEMDYDDAVVDEEVNWRDIKTGSSDPVDIIKEKVYILKDKICRRFKKSKEVVQDLLPGRQWTSFSNISPAVIAKFNLLSLTLMDNALHDLDSQNCTI